MKGPSEYRVVDLRGKADSRFFGEDAILASKTVFADITRLKLQSRPVGTQGDDSTWSDATPTLLDEGVDEPMTDVRL